MLAPGFASRLLPSLPPCSGGTGRSLGSAEPRPFLTALAAELVRRLLPAVVLVAATAAVHAEDGHDLWLRYRPTGDVGRLAAIRRNAAEIVAPGASETAGIVRAELIRGLSGLTGRTVSADSRITRDGAVIAGTPGELPFLGAAGWKAALQGLGPDGFAVRTVSLLGHRATVIAANSEIGVLYGTFAFLRVVQSGRALQAIDLRERPKLEYRLLDHWDNADGTVERGYAGRSLWRWEELPGKLDPRYRDYARADASIGLNGVVLNNGNGGSRLLRADYLPKVAALADVFRPYGIRIYLAVNFSAPLRPDGSSRRYAGGIGDLDTADPFDGRVQAWWRNKADQIYRLIPDFGGFVVKADSEGMPGPARYGRTEADGANLLAAALAPHGGIVMWRAFVYPKNADPDRMKRSYAVFHPLDGRFLENAVVQVKNGPLDFQPCEPFHPLFGAMPRTSLMLELQVTQEYLGQSTALVYLAPMWKAVLDADTYARGPGSTVARVIEGKIGRQTRTGIIGVANTGSDRDWTGNLFGQANWYAFGRLAWDPGLSASQIADEWIAMTWGTDPRVAGPIHLMMLGSWSATVDFMAPLGLPMTCAADHYRPGPTHRAGKLWLANRTGIGYDRSSSGTDAVAQYHQPLRSRLDSLNTCPESCLLWFHFVPWDYRLHSGRTVWEEMVHDYRAGVQYVDGMGRTWAGLAGRIDPERYAMVRKKLAEEARYARQWRDTYVRFLAARSGQPVPQPDPMVAWDLGRIESGRILDRAGRPIGRLDHATPRTIDATHSCVELSDRSSSRVVLTWPKVLTGRQLTISLWVNPWSAPTSLELLRSRNLRLGLYRGNLFARVRTIGKFRMLSTYPAESGNLGVGLGRWHQVAATLDESGAGQVSLYIDGAQVATAPLGGAATEREPSDLEIGGGLGGLVAAIRASNAVWSAQQVRAAYLAERSTYAQIALPPSGGGREPASPPADEALHEAWLHYRPAAASIAAEYAGWFQRIVAPGADPTIRTAADEVALAARRIAGVTPARGGAPAGTGDIVLGTPASSLAVARLVPQLRLDQAGPQGYSLLSIESPHSRTLVIAANAPAGVIAGAFALIRRMQLGQPLANLRCVEAPRIAIRLVNHWDTFRGFPDDAQVHPDERADSIFSWADLRSGRTTRIREWVRLLASAGYNAVCPTDPNWTERNNFLDHLGEVRVLGDIFRDYGIKLYWTPNYLLAPLKSTSDALYAAVPDFSGYLLKFGSEGQPGDPGPASINRIARLLAPHGGTVLLRGFIYGKYSPIQSPVRELIPYRFFTAEDGRYDRNVVVIGKSAPLDFEIREPINPLDGALRKTRYGTEFMIAKDFPMSWLPSWKCWMDFDNFRRGPGTLNRNCIGSLVGIAMIHPEASWTSDPLNMVDYYALGRLAWNPKLTTEQIQAEWIGLTFGPRSSAAPIVDRMLDRSESVANDLMLYHGYRGVWIELRKGALRTSLPYPQKITPEGLGADNLRSGLIKAYAPQIGAFYANKAKDGNLLLFFHFLPYDYVLPSGRTLLQDIHDRLREGAAGAADLLAQWRTLQGEVDPGYFGATTSSLEAYAAEARNREKSVEAAFAKLLAPAAGKTSERHHKR